MFSFLLNFLRVVLIGLSGQFRVCGADEFYLVIQTELSIILSIPFQSMKVS